MVYRLGFPRKILLPGFKIWQLRNLLHKHNSIIWGELSNFKVFLNVSVFLWLTFPNECMFLGPRCGWEKYQGVVGIVSGYKVNEGFYRTVCPGKISKSKYQYPVRQRGCSLTHSTRTPPADHPGMTIWRRSQFFSCLDKMDFERKCFWIFFPGWLNFFWRVGQIFWNYYLVLTKLKFRTFFF